MIGFVMALSRTLLRTTLPGLLTLLAACNQTAQAPATPGAAAPIGSGAVAAIMDVQQTRAANQATSTALNVAGGFDPTGLSAYAITAVEEAQDRALEAKYEKREQEVEKALAQAEAAQALDQELKRKPAASTKNAKR